MPEHVTDVQPPRQGQRDRQDLEAEHAVQAEPSRQPFAATQEERGLLATDRYDGDERHVVSVRHAEEALATVEINLCRFRGGPVRLVVPTGVDEQGRAFA